MFGGNNENDDNDNTNNESNNKSPNSSKKSPPKSPRIGGKSIGDINLEFIQLKQKCEELEKIQIVNKDEMKRRQEELDFITKELDLRESQIAKAIEMHKALTIELKTSTELKENAIKSEKRTVSALRESKLELQQQQYKLEELELSMSTLRKENERLERDLDETGGIKTKQPNNNNKSNNQGTTPPATNINNQQNNIDESVSSKLASELTNTAASLPTISASISPVPADPPIVPNINAATTEDSTGSDDEADDRKLSNSELMLRRYSAENINLDDNLSIKALENQVNEYKEKEIQWNNEKNNLIDVQKLSENQLVSQANKYKQYVQATEDEKKSLMRDLHNRVNKVIELEQDLDRERELQKQIAAGKPDAVAKVLSKLEQHKMRVLNQRLEQLVAVHRRLLRKYTSLELTNTENRKMLKMRDGRLKQLERTLVAQNDNMRIQAEIHERSLKRTETELNNEIKKIKSHYEILKLSASNAADALDQNGRSRSNSDGSRSRSNSYTTTAGKKMKPTIRGGGGANAKKAKIIISGGGGGKNNNNRNNKRQSDGDGLLSRVSDFFKRKSNNF